MIIFSLFITFLVFFTIFPQISIFHSYSHTCAAPTASPAEFKTKILKLFLFYISLVFAFMVVLLTIIQLGNLF